MITFLTGYGIAVVVAVVVNYFIQGPQRIIDEENDK